MRGARESEVRKKDFCVDSATYVEGKKMTAQGGKCPQPYPIKEDDNQSGMARMLVLCAVPLNVVSNVAKCIDVRYLMSSTMFLYLGLQTLLVLVELILFIVVIVSQKLRAMSFISDLTFLALLIAVMELVIYLIDRSIRTADKDEGKKEV
ncbi:hypothetical protein GCK32_006621 [Trichostrongylus colubriformis]|uniref:Uncharacterized protein n=1 Tax=Trichostrongylus colubriformis TaxID=6319 RepID=A0AAN8G990_TRICO